MFDVPSHPLWPIIVAPFIGSFIGVLVTRVRTPATILWGRSACPRCGHRLGVVDLVPVASWLALRGRCRHCGSGLSAFYPLVELAALAVALWAATAMSGSLLWASCALGWSLLALALIDARHYLLPDFLTLPLVLAGLLVNAWLAPTSWLSAALGAGLGFIIVVALRAGYWRLRRREGIGLGDAKLLAAAGAWVGWEGLPSVVLLAALGGLLFVLGRSLRRRTMSATDRIAFGTCLCGGLWLVWLYGPLS